MSMIYVRRDGVAWQSVDDEIIILDEYASRYLKLVGSAITLWPMLVGGTTRDELERSLRDAFELTGTQAGHDVDLFLAELRDNELIEEAAS